MNEQIVLASAAAAGVSLFVALVSTVVAVRAKRGVANSVALAEGIKEGFVAKSTELVELQRRHEELSLRVARLGSLRAKAPAAAEASDELVADAGEKKMTMTERRHRVLQLARRGQDAATISNMLGVPRGEVDLIINLHRAA